MLSVLHLSIVDGFHTAWKIVNSTWLLKMFMCACHLSTLQLSHYMKNEIASRWATISVIVLSGFNETPFRVSSDGKRKPTPAHESINCYFKRLQHAGNNFQAQFMTFRLNNCNFSFLFQMRFFFARSQSIPCGFGFNSHSSEFRCGHMVVSLLLYAVRFLWI